LAQGTTAQPEAEAAAQQRRQEQLQREKMQRQQERQMRGPMPDRRMEKPRSAPSEVPAKAGTRKFGAQPIRSKDVPEGE